MIDSIQSDLLVLEGLEKLNGLFFYEAIKTNPLNGTAWFNYSVFLNQEGKLDSALFAFLMTACLQPGDSEAWCSSLILAFSINRLDIFSIIYSAAQKNIGNNFLNHFSQSILEQPSLSLEEKQELIKAITQNESRTL